ncbi:MAG: CBS domain-containing protein, partial [Dyella sp.]|nr:CBS domain-containing protein [Dyella sp.]
MRASDICTSKVVSIDAGASVVDAAKRMREGHVGALVVTEQPNGERIPVGIVTDRDIVMSVIAEEVAPTALKVGDVMTSPVLTC